METKVERLIRIRDGLPKLQAYVIYMRPTDQFRGGDTEEGAAVLLDHLDYLFDLEAKGILLGSGPVGDYTPERLEGMCFVAAKTLEDAERIAHNEPFHKAGWRINEARKWRINEGVIIDVVRAALERVNAEPSA